MVRSLSRVSVVCAAVAVAFIAGLAVGRAQTPPWTPMIVHVPEMTAADFNPAPPGSKMQQKPEAFAEGGTVSVQMGTVGKHYHANANEVQYIVEGTGQFWLNDRYYDVKPGDLIIIPKGTPHAGTTTTFKAIGIKIPPQAPDDVHPVP